MEFVNISLVPLSPLFAWHCNVLQWAGDIPSRMLIVNVYSFFHHNMREAFKSITNRKILTWSKSILEALCFTSFWYEKVKWKREQKSEGKIVDWSVVRCNLPSTMRHLDFDGPADVLHSSHTGDGKWDSSPHQVCCHVEFWESKEWETKKMTLNTEPFIRNDICHEAKQDLELFTFHIPALFKMEISENMKSFLSLEWKENCCFPR